MVCTKVTFEEQSATGKARGKAKDKNTRARRQAYDLLWCLAHVLL
jgi:hypothetical protein